MEYAVPLISKEMIAAGLEAMHAARLECMAEADVICEIFIAMYGVGTFHEPETVH